MLAKFNQLMVRLLWILFGAAALFSTFGSELAHVHAGAVAVLTVGAAFWAIGRASWEAKAPDRGERLKPRRRALPPAPMP